MYCEWWNIGEGIPWGYSQSWCFKHPQNSFVPLYCCYVWLSLTPFPLYTLRQLLDLWMAIYSLWDHQATHKCHAYQNNGTPVELVIVSTMPNCCVYGLYTLTPQLSPYQTDDYQISGVEGIVGWAGVSACVDHRAITSTWPIVTLIIVWSQATEYHTQSIHICTTQKQCYTHGEHAGLVSGTRGTC